MMSGAPPRSLRRGRPAAPTPTFSRSRINDVAEDPLDVVDVLTKSKQLNPRHREFTVLEVMTKTCRVCLQVSACVLFFGVYDTLLGSRIQAYSLVTVSWVTAAMGHCVYQLFKRRRRGKSHSKVQKGTKDKVTAVAEPRMMDILPSGELIRASCFYYLATFTLAPVLRTLAASISTDTVYATSVLLLALHVLTNNYGVNGFLVSKPLSMNAGIITSIFLASRLKTDAQAIALITLAVQLFVLFPIFSRVVWKSRTFLFGTFGGLSFIILLSMSGTYVTAYVCSMIALLVVLPVFFVICQKYKYLMYGPWDEAVPTRKR